MPWTLRMLMYFTLAGALFQLYSWRKTVKAIESATEWPKKRVRLTAVALVCWMILYPLLMLGSHALGLNNVSRSFQTSNITLDALVTYPFWIGLILAIQLAFFFLAIDVAKLLLFPLYKKRRAAWLRVENWIVIALFGLGAIYTSARVYNDMYNVRIRETEFRIAGLPAEFDGFRIVHIADLQADGRTNGRKLQAYVDAVNRLNTDIVLFAGDLVTGGTDYIEMGAESIGSMKARYGVYACLGDHDFFSDHLMVKQSLEKNGVTVLDNASAHVPVGQTFISLTGITNVYRTRPTESTLERIEAQRAEVSSPTVREGSFYRTPVNILLTHQPSPWLVKHAAERGYDLFLAGHTHGGQIVFPLPGLPLTGSWLETDYVSGFYNVGAMLVSINNGLGMTLAPVRYHAPAEVTLISLKAGEPTGNDE